MDADAQPSVLMDASEIARVLGVLATGIHEQFGVHEQLSSDIPWGIVGIRRRGEILAQRLQEHLVQLRGREIPLGSLDITLYRDDLAELGAQAILHKTEIAFDINRSYLLLVDDVIHTGRSIRAALDALVDLGRPKAIRLVVLVDRAGRELPIQPDFSGVRSAHPQAPVSVLLKPQDPVEEVRIG